MSTPDFNTRCPLCGFELVGPGQGQLLSTDQGKLAFCYDGSGCRRRAHALKSQAILYKREGVFWNGKIRFVYEGSRAPHFMEPEEWEMIGSPDEILVRVEVHNGQ